MLAVFRSDGDNHLAVGVRVKFYTVSGKQIDLENPSQCEIDINDIAHALGMICRFNGHCSHFYSVAEHSLLVESQATGPLMKRAALMHDAAEAYVQDIISPIKRALNNGVYGAISREWERYLAKVFGYEREAIEYREVIKELDLRALATEKMSIQDKSSNGALWRGLDQTHLPFLNWSMPCNPPKEASKLFRDKFTELFGH